MRAWTKVRAAFTRFSQADHPQVTGRAPGRPTISPMREITMQRMNRYAGLAVVASVTVCLLAFVFGQAGRGLEGVPGMVVYAFAAGFGLEFMGAAWTGVWRSAALGDGPCRW